MTKGKMVLELLIYATSAMKNFDQSEASFESHMTTMEASDWSKFFIADLDLWEMTRSRFTTHDLEFP